MREDSHIVRAHATTIFDLLLEAARAVHRCKSTHFLLHYRDHPGFCLFFNRRIPHIIPTMVKGAQREVN